MLNLLLNKHINAQDDDVGKKKPLTQCYLLPSCI